MDARTAAAIVTLAAAAAFTAGCSDRVVNTDDAPPPSTQAPAPAPPPAKIPDNGTLANAFDYYAQADGQTGYYFTSPSKRWVCAIFPRRSAGCQSSTGSTMAVTGAPSSVPGTQDATGTETAATPNAIEVGRDADPRFASLDPPGYALVPGPAAVLPFGKVLAVAGFACNVQESSGISCLSELSGKGFTFSPDGYSFQYTDLPG